MAPWWTRPVAITALGVALTATVAASSGIGFAYAAPSARASLETAVTLVGALVAFLVFGRFNWSRDSEDFAIALALALLALAYPLFVVLPNTFTHQAEDASDWLYLITHAGSASLLCWAALANGHNIAAASSTKRRRDEVNGLWVVGIWAVCAAIVFGLLALFGFDPDAHHAPDVAARLFNQPGISSVRIVTSVLFLGAAIGFSRRSRMTSDRLIGWLGSGCALLAVGDLAYGLFPPVVHSELHFGDVFRLAAVLAFAVGAVAEIHAYWLEIHELARSEARRAVAADLHDGVAQELAFLSARIRECPTAGADAACLAQLRSAADRALAESRRAISALAADEPATASSDIESSVRDIARAAGVRLEFDLPPTSLAWLDRETLIRIVREAVVNAVRHGHPSFVRVAYHEVPYRSLEISDDGVGFDPSAVDATHQFGLTSMRDRARTLGGELTVSSGLGLGTCVEVSWAQSALPPQAGRARLSAGASSPPPFLRKRVSSG
jgi:signal transduction histidine kinase